jgi:uncharacterized protein
LKRVLISGASGLIGSALVGSFAAQGVRVVQLVRGRASKSASSSSRVSWDPLATLAVGVASGFDAVIHLSGESVVGRWTEEKKSAIFESRVVVTRNLATALAKSEVKPGVFVSASAVGFY